MVEIIQISDLHYGSEFVAEYLENIIEYVKEVKPDVVICTGDVVHKGRVVQYENILPYLNRIRSITRLMVIPGNHCAKNSGLIFFERLIALFPVAAAPKTMFIAANSLSLWTNTLPSSGILLDM